MRSVRHLRWPGWFGGASFLGLFLYLAYVGVALEILAPAFGAVSVAAGIFLLVSLFVDASLVGQPRFVRLAVLLRSAGLIVLGVAGFIMMSHSGLIRFALPLLANLCFGAQYQVEKGGLTRSVRVFPERANG